MAERRRTRVCGKIDELPEDVRQEVDVMLVDCSITYQDIAGRLKEKGFDVSKSSIGRYAMRTSAATQRLLEAQAQTEKLVQVVRQNPDADYTEAGMRLLMDGLVNRLATAEDEFDEMPLDKVGRLLTGLSRTKAYKDRVRQMMQSKTELAFDEMESRIMAIIRQDEESVAMLRKILQDAKTRMMADD